MSALHTVPWIEKPNIPQVTPRAMIAGLAIGSLVLISNFQFGLQTGWVSMMSLPSALLACAVFRNLPLSYPFTDVENVFVQSVAVSVGTGPLAYGFVGVIPAIEKFMTPEEKMGFGTFSATQLVTWSFGLAFFGIFFAVPLRKQVIVKEALPFPSGSATATLISVLHGGTLTAHGEETPLVLDSYRGNMAILRNTFTVSALYTLASYFVPAVKAIPVFGTYLSEAYHWNLQPSPAYIGQGCIMGVYTVSYMLFGAVLGWGVLAPLAARWTDDVQGWILWCSLSVMVADSVVGFIVVTARSISQYFVHRDDKIEPDVPAEHLVRPTIVIAGVVVSSVLCIVVMGELFTFEIVPAYASAFGLVLALFLSVLGVRALGETDLNPVSGIGKLSQLLFALVIPKSHPGNVLLNLVAGGIAEAGAQQAGDLMQDLKTGHMLGASPKAQFVAQLVGALWSVLLSSFMYRVYNTVYTIPSDTFRVPTAVIWVDCSRLVTGAGLPPHALEWSVYLGIVFGIISMLKNSLKHTSYEPHTRWLPSGVAVGIGIYNTPSFTIARFIGGLGAHVWQRSNSRTKMIVFSSGLVLGEGCLSVANMLLTALGVPHL